MRGKEKRNMKLEKWYLSIYVIGLKPGTKRKQISRASTIRQRHKHESYVLQHRSDASRDPIPCTQV